MQAFHMSISDISSYIYYSYISNYLYIWVFMYFWYFDLHIILKWYYRDIHHISNLWHQLYSAKRKHHSNKCALNMRVWGMEKKEWDNREIDENSNCMDLQSETKNPSLSSNGRFEWHLHQSNWKGIQLPQNWFTSRESEHSPCNGQTKSL